jgi:hypothetical protein
VNGLFRAAANIINKSVKNCPHKQLSENPSGGGIALGKNGIMSKGLKEGYKKNC